MQAVYEETIKITDRVIAVNGSGGRSCDGLAGENLEAAMQEIYWNYR